jgi:hypothetical protein
MRLAAFAAALVALPGCLVHRWSATPDGKVLAVATRDAVVVVDAGLKPLETYPSQDRPAIVDISPDGKWIVYNTEKVDALWLVDRTTRTQKKIAGGKGVWLYNAWSPKSNRFAFVLKEGESKPDVGALRVYTVATGEAFTAVLDAVPVYSWTPSGNALFAVQAWTRAGEDDVAFGDLLLWQEAEKPKTIARVAGLCLLEALSEDDVLFLSSQSRLPAAPADFEFENQTFGLFRGSVPDAALTPVVPEGIYWFGLSPDRKKFVAWISEKGEDPKHPPIRLELFDASGKSLKVLRAAESHDGYGPVVPFWAGNDRVLVPRGEAGKEALESVDANSGETKDATESRKGWSR